MDDEIWKDVIGFEKYYQVSNLGRVKSLGRERCIHCGYRGKRETLLKQQITKVGYTYVSMSKPGMGRHKTKVWAVHRLVAVHFVEGQTSVRKVVNHKDFVKHNNRWDNLEWMSTSENNKHAFLGGRYPIYKRHNRWTKNA